MELELVRERLAQADKQLTYWREQEATATRQAAMWEGAVEALRGVAEALRGAAVVEADTGTDSVGE